MAFCKNGYYFPQVREQGGPFLTLEEAEKAEAEAFDSVASTMSYYNAAEGQSFFNETAKRHGAEANLREVTEKLGADHIKYLREKYLKDRSYLI